MYFLRICTFHFVAAVVFFGNTIYYIKESQGLVECTIHLSQPLSTDLDITIRDKDGNATGESTALDVHIIDHDLRNQSLLECDTVVISYQKFAIYV